MPKDGLAVTVRWPEGLAQLEEFVRGKGLYFECRGRVPNSGGEIRWQYGNDKIAVRVSADRGLAWSAQLSDVAGWPDQWWVARELKDLIRGPSVPSSLHDHSVEEGMKIIRDNWDEIVEAFAAQNRSRTHTLLKGIRAEWAQRTFKT